jgi:VIT1/CCC1 family predicted Fe2+/Mn2+ transporter
MLDEEALRYAWSMVLGLTTRGGADRHARWVTLAFQNTRLIALSGTSPGSPPRFRWARRIPVHQMRKRKRIPSKPRSTGAAYIVTVILLILPYRLLQKYYVASR